MQVVNQNQNSLRQFIRQISKIPILTSEAVHCYANQVQRMGYLLEVKKALSRSLSREPTFTEWAAHAQLSETALQSSLHEGQRAKRRLIEANLLLVVSIARQHQDRGVDLQDLIQEGTIGLSRAVDKFDPAAGHSFSTYAFKWIQGRINRVIAYKEKTELVLVSPEEQSEVPVPEEKVAKLEQVELVRYLVTQLPERQQNVVTLLYGLNDGKQRSLTQAGKELGLSREQVRWAHTIALETLRTESPQALSLI